MRASMVVVAATFSIGCSGSAAGPSKLPTTASLWGMVVEPSGVCIEGASVEVMDGPALGQRIVQRTPCDVWADDGGFLLTGVIPGAAMTLHATAPGRARVEKVFVPMMGPSTAVLIELPR